MPGANLLQKKFNENRPLALCSAAPARDRRRRSGCLHPHHKRGNLAVAGLAVLYKSQLVASSEKIRLDGGDAPALQ